MGRWRREEEIGREGGCEAIAEEVAPPMGGMGMCI